MQPCGLRNLACPWGRRSFGLKARRFADCIRGALAQRVLKKHSCSPAGCGIWRAFGGDFCLASRLGELRIESAVPLAKRGLKNNHATLWAAGFGTPLGATIVWPQGQAICGLRPRYPWPKGSKKTFMQPCGLRNLARPWGRLSFGLKAGRAAECVRGALAKRALKNIHATLRAAGSGAPSGATFVWPQGRASCGLSPRYPWPKGL